MVVWTYQYYSFANWFIPTALGIITGIILWILPKNSYLFVVDRILGIQKCAPESSKPDKNEPSSTKPPDDIEGNPIEEKIEVDIYDEIIDLRKSCAWRFFIWFLTSLTVSLLWAVIFENLILSSSRVTDAGECPDFTADCFVFKDQKDITPEGPYTCKPGATVNFPTQGSIWCINWVYSNKGMSDILEVLGICGGLLGIVGSIVPFIYYLSSNEKCFPCSISFGIIAAIICIGIVVVLWLWKISISFLTWFVMTLTAGLSILAAVWAFVTVYRKRKLEKKNFTVTKDYSRPRSTAAAMERANMRRQQRTSVNVISEYPRRPVYRSQVTPTTNYN